MAFIVGNDEGYFPVIPEVEERNYPGSIHRVFEHHRHQQKQALYNAQIVDSLSPSRAFTVGNDKGYFSVIPEVEERNYPGSIHRVIEHKRHQRKY
ncbi:hypothetical protein VXS04_04665 [Photobacterium piscicola]|uniref:hypothetical protein n=1 Tax=Photobacterium piscicola TaxID=1378299 RepID=UPI002E182C8F|nr:hypothetical protein [Photobacterium piscicola]